jgi:hypothetical protein
VFGKPRDATQAATLRPHRDDLALYGSWRGRFGAWSLEAGARARRIRDRQESVQQLLEPRLAVRRDIAGGTALRFAWGQFQQQDGLDELRVADGVQRFGAAQRSDHLVAGIERTGDAGLTWRVEAFAKLQLDPRARYENQFNSLSILPELAPDRLRIAPDHSELRGLELSVRQTGHPWSWWSSYVWSQSLDEFTDQDADVPRAWDQRHALSVGAQWQRGEWQVNGLLDVHSGWPTSRLVRGSDGDVSAAERNSARLRAFASLDLRVDWQHRFRPGTMTLSLEITNSLNRRNACCQELILTDSASTPVAVREISWLPMLPALSLLWEFRA